MQKFHTRLAILALCVLLAAMAFTGCQSDPIIVEEPPPEPTPTTEAAPPPEPAAPASPPELNLATLERHLAAHLEIYYVEDGLFDQFEHWHPETVELDQVDSYHEFIEFDEGGHPRIILSTDVPLFHFQFIELQWHQEQDLTFPWATAIYSMEVFSPEQPFVVSWMEWGNFPHRGIHFLDEYGVEWVFAIQKSGYDGTLILVELENVMHRSPRTAVTGILEDPARDWSSISVTAWLEADQWFGDDGTEGTTHVLTHEDAARTFEILSTMAAVEVLTPFHMEGQHSSPMFLLEITFAEGPPETIYTTEMGSWFFRFSGTFGNHGDQGYILGESMELYRILMAYF